MYTNSSSKKMKWTLILFLGICLAETTLGWTYHYSNKYMNWSKARQFCQAQYTDMVVIQSQEENDYLVSQLPNRVRGPYYWIGISKTHKDENWTWIGNNSTWIGEQSWAENEPNNNHITEFCVEIYVNNGPNRGKWNDEKCSNKKSPVCYQAQCNATSCERGRCQETINNTICLCEPGFKGDRCETAEQCPVLNHTSFSGGRMNCSHPIAHHSYNSTCEFSCDENYKLIGEDRIHCDHNGQWTASVPTCTAVECPPLSQPDNGYLSCSGGNQIYNTTCRFKCQPGYLMIGRSAVMCGVTGFWSGPRPACASYKQALLVVAGCGGFSILSCICFCWMKHRKRKKVAQERQPEEAGSPSSDVNG